MMYKVSISKGFFILFYEYVYYFFKNKNILKRFFFFFWVLQYMCLEAWKMWANERLNYWNAKPKSWPGDQLFASVLGSMPRVWLKAHGWPGRSQLLSYVSHMHAWMQVGPSTPKLWPMSFNHCRRIHDDYEIITVQSQLQEMKDEAFSLSCSRRVKGLISDPVWFLGK